MPRRTPDVDGGSKPRNGRHQTSRDGIRLVRFGPGRAGPALGDFCVEPLPLDFWKLKRSYVQTTPPVLLICPHRFARFIKKLQGTVIDPLAPSRRHACLMVAILFTIPSATVSATEGRSGRGYALALCVCQLDAGTVGTGWKQAPKGRHARWQSPEIPGRVIFFIVATGRSPPYTIVSHRSYGS